MDTVPKTLFDVFVNNADIGRCPMNVREEFRKHAIEENKENPVHIQLGAEIFGCLEDYGVDVYEVARLIIDTYDMERKWREGVRK